MKIYLSDLVHNYFPGNFSVPYGVASLAAYLNESQPGAHEIELFKYPRELIDAVKRKKPDIVGFSSYFWNSDLNNVVSRHLKEISPNHVTVFGGPHAQPDAGGLEFFFKERPQVDFYCLGEGELPFRNLVEALQTHNLSGIKGDAKSLPGASYLAFDGRLVFGGMDLCENLGDLPSPYLSGWLDGFLVQELIPTFETNRGCPFKCSFCVCGICSQRNVRTFPLDRVYREFDYVRERKTNDPMWIITDANFGLFPRDIEISQYVAGLRSAHNTPQRVMMWFSKNQDDRITQISNILRDTDYSLIALQSLDKQVLANIHRQNILHGNIPKKIKEYHDSGAKVNTDILCGLPGETYASHLDTLRTCFAWGFDHITTNNVIIFPGAEMDEPQYKARFGLKTKLRIREGSYGLYHGMRSLEYEEIIRSSNDMSEEQMNLLRCLHWLIWLGWNYGLLKPLLRYFHQTIGKSPVDLFEALILGGEKETDSIGNFIRQFRHDTITEWYRDQKELKDHYVNNDNNWRNLLKEGFEKLNYKYTVRLMASQDEFDDLVERLICLAGIRGDDKVGNALARLVKSWIINPRDIYHDSVPQKKLRLPKEVIPYLDIEVDGGLHEENITITLEKAADVQEQIRKVLKVNSFSEQPSRAAQKVLEMVRDAYHYDLRLS